MARREETKEERSLARSRQELADLEKLSELREKKEISNVNDAEKKQLDELEKKYGTLVDTHGKLQAAIEETEKHVNSLTKSVREANKAFSAGEQGADKLASALGITDMNIKLTSESLDGFVERGKELFNISNLFQNLAKTIFDVTIKQTKELDQAVSSLKKTFGVTFGTEMQDNMARTFDSLKGYGVNAEEINKSTVSLTDSLSNFGGMLNVQQDSLIENAALLNKFGISNDNYAKSYQTLTSVFGQAQGEAETTIRTFAVLGDTIGKQPAQIANDFTSMGKSFARYGSSMVDTFFRTEIASKRLGVEVSSLLSISEGFDTFEGAGKAVGELNALLGGPFLNSIEMIQETDPVKRLEMIREAVFASGKDFASMAEYEKKSLAQHIPGIGGDVEALGRIMQKMDQGLIQTVEDMNNAVKGTGNSLDDLKDKSLQSMSIGEIFGAMKENLGLSQEDLKPMVDAFKNILFTVSELINTFRTPIQKGGITGFLASTLDIGSKVINMFTKLKEGILGFIGIGSAKAATKEGVEFAAEEGVEAVAKAGLKKTFSKIPLIGPLVGGIIDYMAGESTGKILAGMIGNLVGSLLGGAIGAFGGPAGSLVLGVGGGLVGEWAAKQIVDIAGLAEGGIVTKPTMAMVGEGGQPEVVTPLDQLGNVLSTFAKTMPSGLLPAGMNQPPIHIKIELDGRELKSFVKNVTSQQLNPLI